MNIFNNIYFLKKDSKLKSILLLIQEPLVINQSFVLNCTELMILKFLWNYLKLKSILVLTLKTFNHEIIFHASLHKGNTEYRIFCV